MRFSEASPLELQVSLVKLHGSLTTNLQIALQSARRLKGRPVHKDTLAFWAELLAHGRAEIRSRSASDAAEIETLLAASRRSWRRKSAPRSEKAPG
jgi:hypothetical protein